MKRIAILLVALFIVGGMAFAQEDGEAYSVTVSGSATAKFGVDLDANTLGFSNATSTDLTVTLVAKYSETAAGESTWTGEIKLKDIELEFDNGSPADFGIAVDYAEVTNGTVYVKIYGAPTDAVDFVDEFKDTDGAPYFGPFDTEEAAIPGRSDVAATGTIANDAGIRIGYASGMITDVSLGIISDGDWEANVNNDFGVDFELGVDLVPDLLSLSAGVFYSAFDAGTLGFGVSPEVTYEGITFDVGFDGQIPDGGDLAFEVDSNLTYDLDDDGDTSVGLGVYYTEDLLDAKFSVTEAGEAGAVSGLGAMLDVRLLDITGTLGYKVGVNLDYTSGGLMPYAKVNYISDNGGTLGASAGVELGSAFTGIDKTTITLDWTANDLGDNVADTTDFNDNNGDVTIAVKVAF